MEEKKEKVIQESWLERLKKESWEAELLVSAIAIFGTFQLFGSIKWLTNYFIDTLSHSQYFIGYFITFFGLIAISMLVSMFIIHFVLRAYWIGLVGLNSVFPDYSIEDSAYSRIYTEKILSILPKLEDSIKKVDEMCSVIFSVAFTFLFIYGYIAIFSTLYLILYNFLSEFIPYYILLIPAIIMTVGMVVQGFTSMYANLKKNRENEKLQILSFKLVKYISAISFGPIYKSILQVSMIFGSNFKKKKALVKLIGLFFISGVIVAGIQLPKTNIFYFIKEQKASYFDNYKTYSDYYKKDNDKIDFLLSPEIKSEKIESNTLEIFIPSYKYEQNIREKVCGDFKNDDTKTKAENKSANAEYLKNCYKKTNLIHIDDKPISVDFLRYNNHPRTNQFGLLCFIDIRDLKKGLHNIKVEKKNNKDENYLEWTIPFYYAPK